MRGSEEINLRWYGKLSIKFYAWAAVFATPFTYIGTQVYRYRWTVDDGFINYRVVSQTLEESPDTVKFVMLGNSQV